ncbi:LysR family transcriptional regulator [Bordetella holmesii]|uniref:LysR substrate-binding domain protein n=2 Tax=Bordetella holmesii TaxID=35814 RepID=A0A158M6C0_9BORD|nr:LysR family transcriptional regulator [Bordetella holmesii]AHV92768.1 bacterial regulatory helix-turn-helix, lysR family protein [Bordetella holmesii ATCC 51541]AIT24810.1 bacterial regulatory helix-turn-helix, lysR family protein [Bordetella holmesii 44057]EWM45381.1 bacterial regulatory helix-turn-helix, lysR family protein [Bordetella holmesii 70147]EWM48324.1 bacterial regulatory helix-turn-helix, lysR family protein [Bordetella holmesii 41130]EWM49497.1 bacterial regulatory helix-turn-
MSFKSLEVFYWVVTLNSFNKAAAKLHTTQPAGSQRVATLESQLGIKALDRTSRTIKLTAKGRVLYDYAERFMALHSEMMQKVAEEQAVSGVIRLGVAETIVHTWLVEFLEQCRKRYPSVTIDFVVDITPALREELKSGALDMAFMLGPTHDDDLVETALCSYELNFLSAPGLRLGKEPLSNSDIAAHPLITFPRRTYPYTFLRQELTTPEHGAPRIFTNWLLSTIVRMAEDGYGICVVPRLAVLKEVEQGRLKVRSTQLALRDLSFAVAYARGSDEPTKAALAALACEIAKASTVGHRRRRRPAK